MTTIQKRKLVRWIAGTAFFIYLGIVITIVAIVIKFLMYRYDTEQHAYFEAKEACTSCKITRKYADYDNNKYYIYYDLPYTVTYKNGKTEDCTEEITITVTSNQFDDARVGDRIDMTNYSLDMKGIGRFEKHHWYE